MFKVLAILAFVGAISTTARADDSSEQRLRFVASRLDVKLELEKGDSQLPLLLETIAAIASSTQDDKKQDAKKQLKILINDDQFSKLGPSKDAFDSEKTSIKFRDKVERFPLSTVLDAICAQIDAGYIVRSEFIEIVPMWILRKELNHPHGPDSDLRNLVIRFYDNVPLQTAFNDLAEKYNRNVILSPLAQKEMEQKVTARLINVPFDAAVETLADMADLKLVRKSNVTLVTTKEQATVLNAEYEKRHKAERERPAPGFFPLRPLSLPRGLELPSK
jgi:hypothetical protein